MSKFGSCIKGYIHRDSDNAKLVVSRAGEIYYHPDRFLKLEMVNKVCEVVDVVCGEETSRRSYPFRNFKGCYETIFNSLIERFRHHDNDFVVNDYIDYAEGIFVVDGEPTVTFMLNSFEEYDWAVCDALNGPNFVKKLGSKYVN